MYKLFYIFFLCPQINIDNDQDDDDDHDDIVAVVVGGGGGMMMMMMMIMMIATYRHSKLSRLLRSLFHICIHRNQVYSHTERVYGKNTVPAGTRLHLLKRN